MLQSITISNFKAITHTSLVLNNLTSVNYLVGVNGSGKSSILEAMSILNFLSLEQRTSWEQALSGDLADLIKNNFRLKVVTKTDQAIEFSLTNGAYKLVSTAEVVLNYHGPLLINLKNFDNESDKDLRGKYLSPLPISPEVTKIWLECLARFGIDINSKTNLKSNFSVGQKFIIILLSQIVAVVSGRVGDVVGLEEPEKYLHPNFQKQIPSILDILSREFKIQFIIATHSPFIVSSAAKFGQAQAVYLIKNGQTRDAETEELSTSNSQNGYTGGECLLAVSEMLDLGVADFSPHTIIFCEMSLKLLLTEIFSRDIPSSTLILTEKGGGDDDRISKNSEIWDSVKKADKNNILKYRIYGMVDKLDQTNPKLVEKQTKWKLDLKEKIIISSTEELELAYPIDLVNEFLKSKDLPLWNKDIEPSFSKIYLKRFLDGKFIKDFYRQKYQTSIKNDLASFVGQRVDKNFIKDLSPELYASIFN